MTGVVFFVLFAIVLGAAPSVTLSALDRRDERRRRDRLDEWYREHGGGE